MEFAFEQNEQGIRAHPVKVGLELDIIHYSFQIPLDEYIRRRGYGNGNHRASGSRLEPLEEMQRITVRQTDPDASEIERENLHRVIRPAMIYGAET